MTQSSLRSVGALVAVLFGLVQAVLALWRELPLRHRARALRALGRAFLRAALCWEGDASAEAIVDLPADPHSN